jgi:hypothetical protein
MDLARIAELFLDGRGGGWLQKLTEACSGVGKPPRWKLDPK